MADLNTLLRWAVENSTNTQEPTPVDVGGGMTLTYKPAAPGATASANAATLHPTDAQYPIADLSPASTPGPGTPADPSVPLPDGSTPLPRSELNSDILDVIMGKSDSVTMKEKMGVATNTSADLEERVDALDEFEMLIEMIDNANNMAVLKLWQPLLSLLDSEHADIVRHALWIVGTAAQNNLKGQAALFMNDALPRILALLAPSVAGPTRAKAVYALSAAVKHWPLAAAALSEDANRGFGALAAGVADSDRVIARKMSFLLGTLVAQARDKFDEAEMPGEVRALLTAHTEAHGGVDEDLLVALARTGVLAAAVGALVRGADQDVEYEENLVRALARAAEALTAEEKGQLKATWNAWGPKGQAERGFEGQDAKDVEAALA